MNGPEAFWAHLRQPEYLHVLLHPLPICGIGLGLIAMIVALFLKEPKARWVALAVVFVSALAAWPVAELGEGAYDRVLAMADRTGGEWLDTHMERAEKVLWVFYVTAGLAALAVFVPLKWPKTAQPLFLATLLATVVSLGCGGWIAQAGGQIRHSEFRYGPPPSANPGGGKERHNE